VKFLTEDRYGLFGGLCRQVLGMFNSAGVPRTGAIVFPTEWGTNSKE